MEQWRREDFDHSPMIVFYEVTRSCDLACKHCRADAQRARDPRELSEAEARWLIRQVSQFPKKPLLVLTGGDPLKREDVFELVREARLTVEDMQRTNPLPAELQQVRMAASWTFAGDDAAPV